MFTLTPRLMLRPGWPEDAPALAHAIGYEQVVMKLSRVPWPYREQDARDFLDLAWETPAARFIIVERESDRLIGCIEADEGLFGYWLTPDAWGRGYATEAGHAVLAVARDALRMERLSANYFDGNLASARVLQKLGFRETGRIVREHVPARQAEVDAVETVLDLTAPVAMAA